MDGKKWYKYSAHAWNSKKKYFFIDRSKDIYLKSDTILNHPFRLLW